MILILVISFLQVLHWLKKYYKLVILFAFLFIQLIRLHYIEA